jgi:hypothetical protein
MKRNLVKANPNDHQVKREIGDYENDGDADRLLETL